MKSGKCPKCNSTNVYKCMKGLDWGSKSQWLEVWLGELDFRTNLWTGFESYACTDCGYFETYLVDPKAADAIKATWIKVT